MAQVANAIKSEHGAVHTAVKAVTPVPEAVLQRVEALKRLQIEYFRIQAEFHQEVAELEHKYYAKYEALVTKRRDIVNGDLEPGLSESPKVGGEGANQELACESQIKSSDLADQAEVPKGIPNFWLTCLKNVTDDIPEVVTDDDEPILQHLTDVTVEDNIDSFKVHFHFAPNDYFTNEVLTKEFKLSLGPSEENPLDFDGPEITAMKGTKIEWKSEDKNVTQRIVTNKQRNKNTGQFRTVVKTVPTDSFFNFFANPEWVEDKDDMNHYAAANFQAGISLGSFLRERLIPRAVLYFTGETADDDFDGDDFDEDLEEETNSETDSEFDPVPKGVDESANRDDCKQH